MIQVYFRGHGASSPAEDALDVVLSSEVVCAAVRAGAAEPPLALLSRFSLGVDGDAAPADLPKSNAVPGVLGVFVPNDANAPVPSPKAVEPPDIGDEVLLVVKGEMALKGFVFPCDESAPPKRLELEKVRAG